MSSAVPKTTNNTSPVSSPHEGGHRNELVFFKRPPFEARLMCYGLSKRITENELRRIFEVFGMLQSLHIRGDQAFVNFYTTAAAASAMAEIGSHEKYRVNSAAPTLYGKPLEVRRRTKLTPSAEQGDWLRSDEAILQANTLLGFGGWSCCVTELQQIEVAEPADEDESCHQLKRRAIEYREVEDSRRGKSNTPEPEENFHGLFRSHWFAIVCVRLHPRVEARNSPHATPPSQCSSSSSTAPEAMPTCACAEFEEVDGGCSCVVEGRGYGLAGASDASEASGLGKKAAVNMARCTALRRVCLVLLDGVVRYAHVLPPEPEIETSIVWENAGVAKPTRSELPSRVAGDDDYDVDEEEEEEGGGGDFDESCHGIIRSGADARNFVSQAVNPKRVNGGSADEQSEHLRAAGRVLRDLDKEDRQKQRSAKSFSSCGVTGNWRLARALSSCEPAPKSEAALFFEGKRAREALDGPALGKARP